MFFIMGISQANKKLNYDQLVICKCCGKYGHMQVFMTYSYFMFFFIPIIRWNKRYFVKMNCCNSECEINKDLGKAVEKGEVSNINIDNLNFGNKTNNLKHCSYCGFTTNEEFTFCPKCGRQL